MSQPLTPSLLRRRTQFIFERVMEDHGPVEEIVWELVRCDRCGLTIHLLNDGYPEGWWTDGSFEKGWTDLCRACSQ